MAALRFRYAPPAASHGAGGNLALTINADHSVGAGHECLDDVDGFLTQNYQASDYKKVDDFIDERMNVVECLLYMARLDGNLTKAQKAIIYEYVKQASRAAFLTDAIIQNLLKDFADDLSPQKFRKLLTQMHRERPESFAELCDLGEKVVAARRGDAVGGRAALALTAAVRR